MRMEHKVFKPWMGTVSSFATSAAVCVAALALYCDSLPTDIDQGVGSLVLFFVGAPIVALVCGTLGMLLTKRLRRTPLASWLPLLAAAGWLFAAGVFFQQSGFLQFLS